ncbi:MULTISPECIES: hypothetical protein [unclassified Streptomyces]|uniref:hypothetical protein n=1 Tax=unclassified Streptomyces TaxID=2593676 RepID=UPI00226FB118|nr:MULTISPECIES: hypothetical protein [unclassified Streptomyces]MCY0924547.1 hypothetical protein [Streptomyces sp. H27-G5]MCY0963242.1 hypothetical protein [Streptomyces sp. H27-H5]
MTSERRRLGTRPTAADNPELSPGPRARLAAERLPADQAAGAPPTRTTGRRTLGTGPVTDDR